MQEQNKDLEQNISLRNYMDVVVKRRLLILVIFVLSVTAVITTSFFKPKIYEVSMIIEPGVLGFTDSDTKVFADSPYNIKAKIEAGAFNSNVINALKLNSHNSNIKLDVKQPKEIASNQPKESTFLKICIKVTADNKEMGINILNQYITELANYYKDEVDAKKGEIDRRIELISDSIKIRNDSIGLNEKDIAIMTEREKELQKEIEITKANTGLLLNKRDALLEKKIQADNPSLLLYSNVIQQNVKYCSELNNQISDVKMKIDGIVNSIKVLQININDLSIMLEKLKLIKGSIRSINLIQKPEVSSKPIDSGSRNDIILTGILSLMVGVFLAFFMEYWNRTNPLKGG